MDIRARRPTHGFRSTDSTLLNEQGLPPDVIELQLAHKERNQVRAVYNRSQRLAERRKMMHEWADYLDGLKTDTDDVLQLPVAATIGERKVTPIRRKTKRSKLAPVPSNANDSGRKNNKRSTSYRETMSHWLAKTEPHAHSYWWK